MAALGFPPAATCAAGKPASCAGWWATAWCGSSRMTTTPTDSPTSRMTSSPTPLFLINWKETSQTHSRTQNNAWLAELKSTDGFRINAKAAVKLGIRHGERRSASVSPELKETAQGACLGGPSAGAVRETYRKAGFELNQDARELPDHLALELEFMGRLLSQGALAEARAFFTEHLGGWAFRCLEEIRRKAVSGFYQAVSDALTVFLKHEQDVLNEGR